MQKTATKKTNNLFDFFKKKKLNIKEIEKLYLNTNSTQKIGLEYERLSLDKNTLENASYEKLSKIIEHFSNIQNWDLIYDNETIIGAKSKTNTSISLEPGCQLEISLSPKENISEINFELNEIISLLDKIANSCDVFFLGYGISPKSQSEDIALLNKKRYKIMFVSFSL